MTRRGCPRATATCSAKSTPTRKGASSVGRVEFLIYDDRSDTKAAPTLYEKLIVEDKVDAVLGPYGSPLTEAVAPVTEKHRKVMLAPLAATSSIWEQGRR